MSLVISVSDWGGFYVHRGISLRICLGWVSITLYPVDIETMLADILEEGDRAL